MAFILIDTVISYFYITHLTLQFGNPGAIKVKRSKRLSRQKSLKTTYPLLGYLARTTVHVVESVIYFVGVTIIRTKLRRSGDLCELGEGEKRIARIFGSSLYIISKMQSSEMMQNHRFTAKHRFRLSMQDKALQTEPK